MTTTTVGIFVERQEVPEVLWPQCDEPQGRHRGLRFVGQDAGADHVLLIGTPFRRGVDPKLGWFARLAANWRKDRRRRKLDAAWAALGTRRERTTVLFYEPTPLVHDDDYASARAHAAQVFGTDARAPRSLVLPTTWMLDEDVRTLRAEKAPVSKPVPLAMVTSGRRLLPGHDARLRFLERLHAAGVPLQLFGRGLPTHLAARGPIASKGTALRPARYVLAIENHDQGDCYVTEKLWDPLLTWSLPLYYGPAAAERVLPPDAFVRLPDLEAGGVEAVREALANPAWWDQRLETIGEARRRILGDLRMVEWIRRCVVGGATDWPPAAC